MLSSLSKVVVPLNMVVMSVLPSFQMFEPLKLVLYLTNTGTDELDDELGNEVVVK